MENELQNAREVQRVLLPQENPVLAGFRISGTNLPARIISGDYYDYLELGANRFGVAIADVDVNVDVNDKFNVVTSSYKFSEHSQIL